MFYFDGVREATVAALKARYLPRTTNDHDLDKLVMDLASVLGSRDFYNKDLLNIGGNGKKLDFYGGSSGKSRIPPGTSYAHLERTHLPQLSKKLLKCRAEVKPLFQFFSSKEFMVVWYASSEEVLLECYMDADEAPIIRFSVEPVDENPNNNGLDMKMDMVQSPKWRKIVTAAEADCLVIIVSQRFLREKGHFINPDIFHFWVEMLTIQCFDKALYKNAADLALIRADVTFSQRFNNEVHVTEMDVLDNLAFTLETSEKFHIAASIYEDLLKARDLGIQIDPETSQAYLSRRAACVYFYAGDYIKAEAFEVATVRDQVHMNKWDWDTLKRINHFAGSIVGKEIPYEDGKEMTPEEWRILSYSPMGEVALLLRTYDVIQMAIFCNLHLDVMYCKLWEVYMLIGVLFLCADCPIAGMKLFHPEITPTNLLQNVLPRKAARRAIIEAFSKSTVEEYHAFILSHQSSCFDLRSALLGIQECLQESGSDYEMFTSQTRFLVERKKELKINKFELLWGWDASRCCHGCGESFKARRMKECPCKKTYYCSVKCHNTHWNKHKAVCPVYAARKGR